MSSALGGVIIILFDLVRVEVNCGGEKAEHVDAVMAKGSARKNLMAIVELFVCSIDAIKAMNRFFYERGFTIYAWGRG
jgi:hypothetical protein